MKYTIKAIQTNNNQTIVSKQGEGKLSEDLQNVLYSIFGSTNRDFTSVNDLASRFTAETQMIRNDPDGTTNKFLFYKADLISFGNEPMPIELRITLSGIPEEISQGESDIKFTL